MKAKASPRDYLDYDSTVYSSSKHKEIRKLIEIDKRDEISLKVGVFKIDIPFNDEEPAVEYIPATQIEQSPTSS